MEGTKHPNGIYGQVTASQYPMFQKPPLGWPLQLIETTQPEFEVLGVPKT